MATTAILRNIVSGSLYYPKYSMKQTLVLNSTRFLSSKSFSKLKKQSLISTIQIKQLKRRSRRTHSFPFVFAAQSNFLRVLQTVWKLGNDGIEAGTKLVPDSVPMTNSEDLVTVVAVTLALFVLKSFVSTASFVLAMLGLAYFTFIALNKDDGPRGGGGITSTEDTLEEARRIMEKYKYLWLDRGYWFLIRDNNLTRSIENPSYLVLNKTCLEKTL
ncbi:hypothetical protein F0562_021047 [Nyssa sinensis]|uniref:Uncharacterized protein n=1 Tax=Nyssa sinensis TaxID=561372 RepID=A0A5J5BLB5_9ASTE|nr:hypothetical protein F0562_021047 [Nyssa sinensis]